MKVYEYIIRLKDQATDKVTRFTRAVTDSRGRVDRFRQAADQATGSTNMFSGAVGTLTRWLSVAALGAALSTATVKASSLARQFEQTTISFEVLIGNARQGRALLGDIETMAIKTPFKSADLQSSGKLLLGYGVNAQKIMPTLKMLGDISGGNAEKLHLLSLAFAQSQAAGRLMGQDLLQMVNAGFNPLQTISEKTGISMGVLKKRMEDGAISAKLVEAAFRSATQEGGRFYQMMEKQSATFEGRLNALSEKWDIWLRGIGMRINESLAPHLDTVINLLDKAIDPQSALQAATDKQTDSFHKLKTSIEPAIDRYEELLKLQAKGKDVGKELTQLNDKIGTSILGAANIDDGRITGIDVNRARSYIHMQQKQFERSNKVALESAAKERDSTQRLMDDFEKDFSVLQNDDGSVSKGGMRNLQNKYIGADNRAGWERMMAFFGFSSKEDKEFEHLRNALSTGDSDTVLKAYSDRMTELNEQAKSLDQRILKLTKDQKGVYQADEKVAGDDWKVMGDDIMGGKDKDGINKITGGGKQAINVTINVERLSGIENIQEVNGQMEIKDLVKLIEEKTMEAMIRIVNSGNYAAQQ